MTTSSPVRSTGTLLETPTNSATNGGRGTRVQRRGRGRLLDAARLHHADPVGHRERLFLVVGDEDGGDREPLLEGADLVAQLGADLGVERRERLVQEQDPRLDREGPRKCDPLLLSSRHLVGVLRRLVGEADQLEQLGGLLPSLAERCLRIRKPYATLLIAFMFGNNE